MASQYYIPASRAEVPVTVFRRTAQPPGVGYGNVNGRSLDPSGGYGTGYYGAPSNMVSRGPGVAPMSRSGSIMDEDSPGASPAMPSSKAQDLADDIEMLESKCNQLEDRNSWLTRRLLENHKAFIQKTLLGNSRNRLRLSFEAWREAMQEMGLERQLEEQTMSLDQCQQVAKELGAALAQEQHARKTSEADHKKLQDDLQRAILQEKRLKDQFKDQQFQVEIMENRVHEAESCLARSRADAQAVVESAMEYDKRRHEIESSPKRDENFRRRPPASPLEHGLRAREEAEDVMRSVSGYLQRPLTPER